MRGPGGSTYLAKRLGTTVLNRGVVDIIPLGWGFYIFQNSDRQNFEVWLIFVAPRSCEPTIQDWKCYSYFLGLLHEPWGIFSLGYRPAGSGYLTVGMQHFKKMEFV
jgi:hypothetical protein